jgi:hypothetical protein
MEDLKPIRVARLDHDNVFFGLEERAIADVRPGELVFGPADCAEALPSGAVYVDRDCDNAPGKYKWVAGTGDAVGQFVPLPLSQQKPAEKGPTLEQCVYDLIMFGASAPRVQAWARWFEKTIDAQGAV